jgi:hypothetical protein
MHVAQVELAAFGRPLDAPHEQREHGAFAVVENLDSSVRLLVHGAVTPSGSRLDAAFKRNRHD